MFTLTISRFLDPIFVWYTQCIWIYNKQIADSKDNITMPYYIYVDNEIMQYIAYFFNVLGSNMHVIISENVV